MPTQIRILAVVVVMLIDWGCGGMSQESRSPNVTGGKADSTEAQKVQWSVVHEKSPAPEGGQIMPGSYRLIAFKHYVDYFSLAPGAMEGFPKHSSQQSMEIREVPRDPRELAVSSIISEWIEDEPIVESRETEVTWKLQGVVTLSIISEAPDQPHVLYTATADRLSLMYDTGASLSVQVFERSTD